MRLAVVAGGWHFPLHFYEELLHALPGADLFVIAHRNPELPIVREEKQDILGSAVGPLADLDRDLYSHFPSVEVLRFLGWYYREAENTVGDWGFLNQWLDLYDYRKYDAILSSHDDTYIRRHDLHKQLEGDWLILSNGSYPQAPTAYVRGSFDFFKKELLDMLGGIIPLGNIRLTREGKVDSPVGLNALSEWNNTCVPLRQFMSARCLQDRIKHLSPYYRISPYVIEGERGFLHFTDGVPWSLEQGLKETGLVAA